FTVRVRCSSGTYVRTLAHDIGASLGTGAHLSALRRIAVGHLRIEDALTLDEIERQGEAGTLTEGLIKPATALRHLPMLQIGDADVQLVANGRELTLIKDEDVVKSTLSSAM